MNWLTARMLEMGFDENNHPDHVVWVGREFEYTWEFAHSAAWVTPCGLFCRIHDSDQTSCNGVVYCLENDNYLLDCPRPDKAPLCPYLVRLGNHQIDYCPIRLAKREYDYDRSVERIVDEVHEMERLFFEHALEVNPAISGCGCRYIDPITHRTEIEYNPKKCVVNGPNGCTMPVCAFTGKTRDISLGNIYYDVRTVAYKEVGFDKWIDTTVIRGRKWFNNRLTVSCLADWLKVYESEIHRRGERERKISPRIFSVIENIRIAKRPNLHQNEEAPSVRVLHASDMEKKIKQEKKEKRDARKAAAEKRKNRPDKYEPMTLYPMD